LAAPFLVVVKREAQSQMMKVFANWQRDLPLLNYSLRSNMAYVTWINMKIVGRIAAKVTTFLPLCEALSKLRAGLEQRIKQEGGLLVISTPFPALNSPNNPVDMSELSQTVQQAYARMFYT